MEPQTDCNRTRLDSSISYNAHLQPAYTSTTHHSKQSYRHGIQPLNTYIFVRRHRQLSTTNTVCPSTTVTSTQAYLSAQLLSTLAPWPPDDETSFDSLHTSLLISFEKFSHFQQFSSSTQKTPASIEAFVETCFPFVLQQGGGISLYCKLTSDIPVHFGRFMLTAQTTNERLEEWAIRYSSLSCRRQTHKPFLLIQPVCFSNKVPSE